MPEVEFHHSDFNRDQIEKAANQLRDWLKQLIGADVVQQEILAEEIKNLALRINRYPDQKSPSWEVIDGVFKDGYRLGVTKNSAHVGKEGIHVELEKKDAERLFKILKTIIKKRIKSIPVAIVLPKKF